MALGESVIEQSGEETMAVVSMHSTIWLSREVGDGYGSEVGLLRPSDWLSSSGVFTEGDRLELDLPEMGVAGEYQVMSIEPFAERSVGGGGLVTGCFRFSRGVICDLRIEGESEVIGVTALHPIWSEDRQGWIAAGELRVGERLQRADGGTAVLLESRMRPQVEPVYNIEVEGDHCYRVGEQGLLVHNESVIPAGVDFGCEQKSGSGSTECSSAKLWNSIGGKNQDWQPHHLIPCSLRAAKSYSVLDRAEKLGFDYNGKRNGLRLPSKDAMFAQMQKLPLHKGRPIGEYLNCLDIDLISLQAAYQGGKLTDCEICPRLYAIADKYAAALASLQIWLSHNDLNKKSTYKCP